MLWNDVNAQRYMENLNAKLLLIIKNFFLNEINMFEDDNAPCYWAKTVEEWMKKHRVSTLNWPAHSRDLNPIRNSWSRMAKIVSSQKPTTKVTLTEPVINAWHHVVTENELEKLYETMPRRCRLMIESKGWLTKH